MFVGLPSRTTGLCMILRIKTEYFRKRIYELIPVMDTCCVFFEVWTEFVNIIQMSVGFKVHGKSMVYGLCRVIGSSFGS
jgi:hypothetical protein